MSEFETGHSGIHSWFEAVSHFALLFSLEMEKICWFLDSTNIYDISQKTWYYIHVSIKFHYTVLLSDDTFYRLSKTREKHYLLYRDIRHFPTVNFWVYCQPWQNWIDMLFNEAMKCWSHVVIFSWVLMIEERMKQTNSFCIQEVWQLSIFLRIENDMHGISVKEKIILGNRQPLVQLLNVANRLYIDY